MVLKYLGHGLTSPASHAAILHSPHTLTWPYPNRSEDDSILQATASLTGVTSLSGCDFLRPSNLLGEFGNKQAHRSVPRQPSISALIALSQPHHFQRLCTPSYLFLFVYNRSERAESLPSAPRLDQLASSLLHPSHTSQP